MNSEPNPTRSGAQELEIVKRLLGESSGARDFLRRAISAGFTLDGENYNGVSMSGQNSAFIFDVRVSTGRDTIHGLTFKEYGKNAVHLV